MPSRMVDVLNSPHVPQAAGKAIIGARALKAESKVPKDCDFFLMGLMSVTIEPTGPLACTDQCFSTK